MTLNFRHVDIADEYLGYFDNNRVDEMNGDSLLIIVNVTNALGAENLDSNSASYLLFLYFHNKLIFGAYLVYHF